jgi:hypothetical protein
LLLTRCEGPPTGAEQIFIFPPCTPLDTNYQDAADKVISSLSTFDSSNPFACRPRSLAGKEDLMNRQTELGCSPAKRQKVQAFYHNGTLAIVAEGKIPSACYEVTIDQGPLDVEPPQYALNQRRKSGVFCALQVVDYSVTQPFSIGSYHDHVIVFHRDGLDEVEVQQIEEYSLDSRIQLTRGRVIPVPYILPPSEGNSDEQGWEGVVTGYSSSLSFDEAFRNALFNLEKNPEWNPDDMPFTVRVDGIFGEFGGFVGYRRMGVRIQAEYI